MDKILKNFTPKNEDFFLNPEWDVKEKCIHDWRKYISKEIKEIWEHLSDETKRAFFITAENQADQEEWE